MRKAQENTLKINDIDCRFNRVFISKKDMEKCIEFVDAAIRATDDNSRRGLITAVIVSYARPFSDNKAHKKAVSKPQLRKLQLTQEEKALHDKICNLRNKTIAHSDFEISVDAHPDFKMNIVEVCEYSEKGYLAKSRLYDPLEENDNLIKIRALAEKVKSGLAGMLFDLSSDAHKIENKSE